MAMRGIRDACTEVGETIDGLPCAWCSFAVGRKHGRATPINRHTFRHAVLMNDGRARLLAGRTIPGGIDASSMGDTIRPARSRDLPIPARTFRIVTDCR